MMRAVLCLLCCLSLYTLALAQDGDTVIVKNEPSHKVSIRLDTAAARHHDPRKATILSAILPGAGQIYNKKYWKVPIVYTAIGIPVYLFFDNKNWYNKTRDAAKMIANGDTADYRNRVDPQLYVFFTRTDALNSLLNYRNDFRRNMDYSILFTLLFWGLNVVDATVDAHLKEFDISEDLSMKIKPTLLSGGQTAGISVIFTIGKNNHPKKLPSLRW